MKENKIETSLLYAFMAVTCTVLLANVTKNLYETLLDGVVCLHACILIFLTLGYDKENYWLMHLILLFLINNFALPKISRKFLVPKIDLDCVSLVFLNIFLINAFF